MLPSDLKTRALRRARSRGISLGEMIRESLAAMLAYGARKEGDSLLADKAVFDGSSPRDTAAKHDDYLYGDKA